MYPNRLIAVNPVWQCLAVVDFFMALFGIAGAAKGLGVPDETGAALDNWFNMIQSEFFKRKFNITSEAMEIIESTKGFPFSGSVKAARLGFAGAANIEFSLINLSAPFRLLILTQILLVLFGLLVLPMGLFALFGLPVLPLDLLTFFGLPILFALFGLLIFPPTYFALTSEPIFCTPVLVKPLSRFDLTTLTTRLHHFAVSLFFRYLNYTAVKGET